MRHPVERGQRQSPAKSCMHPLGGVPQRPSWLQAPSSAPAWTPGSESPSETPCWHLHGIRCGTVAVASTCHSCFRLPPVQLQLVHTRPDSFDLDLMPSLGFWVVREVFSLSKGAFSGICLTMGLPLKSSMLSMRGFPLLPIADRVS